MTKKMFLASSLCLALTAQAGDYKYLTVESSDGTMSTLLTAGLKITFTDNQLVATNGSDNKTFDLNQLKAMRFSKTGESSDIKTIETASASFQDADAIYDLRGRQVSPTNIGKGLYIVKKDNRTYKVIIK